MCFIFCTAKHFLTQRGEYLQVFPLKQYEDVRYIYGDSFQAPQTWVGWMLMSPSVTVDVPGLLPGL